MSGPARSGLFIYAKDLNQVATFYQSLLAMPRAHTANDLVVLRAPDLEILVHAIPAHVAAEIEISSPPTRRDEAAYKFFFTVASLADAATSAALLGGEVLPEQWHAPGFIVSNAIDPEGNIFQLRQRVP